jgi:hypothetical protein
MIDCLLTAAVVTAIAWISYEVGRIVGREEGQAGKHRHHRQVAR